MAGEVMLINPRRRRRRKARRARSHRPARRVRRRRTARAVAYANPRRRRRARRHARRHVARRRRHHVNPRIGGLNVMGLPLGQAGLGLVGFFGTNVAAAQLRKMLPPSWAMDENVTRLGIKAVVGIGGTMVLRKVNRPIANAFALGAAFNILVDLVKTFAPANLGLGAYQSGTLEDYQPGILNGYGDVMGSDANLQGGVAYGGGSSAGAYGGSAY
jgi:hypothetical protein